MTDGETPQSVAAAIARMYREDAKRWTQGTWARNADGKNTRSADRTAVCWCLRGAIDKLVVPIHDGDLAPEDVYKAFDAALGHPWREPYDVAQRVYLVEWNDQPQRTIAEVIELCEEVAAS